MVPFFMVPRPRFLDLTAITICTLAWGTTWYVITFQLGVVDPVVSLTYRFTLATALLSCSSHSGKPPSTDGGAGTTLYVKESGTGNTGWTAK